MSAVELNMGNHKKILGKRLFNLVMGHKGRTFDGFFYRIKDEKILIHDTRPFELDARDIVNACKARKKTINGSRFKKDAILAVEEALKTIYINRIEKQPKWRYTYKKHRAIFAEKLSAPLSERLNAFKKKLEENYAGRLCDVTSREIDHSFHLTLTKDQKITVENRKERTYPYSGQSKHSTKLIHHTDIWVSRSTLDNVIGVSSTIQSYDDPFNSYLTSLCVGGMPTLEMTELNLAEYKADSGVRAFRAKWLEKKGRAEFILVEGFIAVINSNADADNRRERDATIYHSEKSLKHALSGLLRKRKQQTRSKDEIALISAKRKAKHIKSLSSKLGNEWVYVSDSNEVGNCESGRRHWMSNVDIDPKATKITFKELLEAYQKHPVKEAWSVVLHVEKRLKQSARKQA